MKTLSHCVTEFLDTDEVRKLSVSSKKRQKIVYNMLFAEFPLTQPIARLEPRHIHAALGRARDRGVTKSTMNAYKSDLRRLAKWLHDKGLTKINVAAGITNDKSSTPAYKRRPITAVQASELISVAERIHPRDGMTALLMLATGMRSVEVVGLTWGDFEISEGVVRAYRSKIEDYHEAFLIPEVTAQMRKWQTYYEERHGAVQRDWYVVPALAHKGQRPGHFTMSPAWPMVPNKIQHSVGLRVKRWLREVGETDLRGRAAHTLRRTAGNLLADTPGIEIRDVQTFFGHASVAQTEQYLDKSAARDKLRQRINGFSLRAPEGTPAKG